MAWLRLMLRTGLHSMRRNLVPGLFLWLLGLALVLAYYYWPAARPWFSTVRDLKQRGGYGFSAVTGALAGGLAPFLIGCATGQFRRGRRLTTALFMMLLWSYRGVEVDAFYRFQGWLFGTGTDPLTVVKKTTFDMLGYAAFWTLPCTSLAYRYALDCQYSWSRFYAGLDKDLFTVQIPALIMAAWAVWTPAVCIIYSMPPDLQIPLFNVVLCFWVLLVGILAKNEKVVCSSKNSIRVDS